MFQKSLLEWFDRLTIDKLMPAPLVLAQCHSGSFFTEAEPRPTGHAARGNATVTCATVTCLVDQGSALVPVQASHLADEGRQVIEAVALVTGYCATVAVVGPWGYK